MTYLVANPTPDSGNPNVMVGCICTQGTVSSIPIVGSISPEGFLSLILLLVVIIATVVVAIVEVVIVVVVFGVVVVVGGVSFIIKLSFMASSTPIGWAIEFHQNKASSIVLPELWQLVYVRKDGGTRIRSCFRDELDNVVEEEDGE
ncbi:hypothetical protein Tco_0573407 [Tanacetum coccineum]